MNVRDLERSEWNVLLALLGHLAEADDRIDPREVLELHGVAEEFGEDDIMSLILRARAVVRTRMELMAAAASVTRPQARDLMRTVLHDLAQADGERSEAEQDLLDDLARVWVRA